MAACAALKGYVSIDLGRNATIVIELAVGLAVGMAAQTARRAHAELERAARLSASLEERERLSRQVHDGAIQVLALVARRGREIGGATAQLAELAGEQERALRRLVSAPASRRPRDATTVRHRGAAAAAGLRPGVGECARRPVLLDAAVADELDAAVINVLDNVERARRARCPRVRSARGSRRIGHGQRPRRRRRGSPTGGSSRPSTEGRLGIAKSIVGRMKWLGGTRRAEHRTRSWHGMGADRATRRETPVSEAADHGDGRRRPPDLARRGGPRPGRRRLRRRRDGRRRGVGANAGPPSCSPTWC